MDVSPTRNLYAESLSAGSKIGIESGDLNRDWQEVSK